MDTRVIKAGDKLFELFDRLGVNNTEAADFLGVERRTVQRWLNGSQRTPEHVLVLLGIMANLGMSVDEARKMSERPA